MKETKFLHMKVYIIRETVKKYSDLPSLDQALGIFANFY